MKENYQLKDSLGHIARPCLKNTKTGCDREATREDRESGIRQMQMEAL